MSVDLNPSSQLAFHRPLTQLVKRTLTISNANSQPVAFKVKTTAPKQYCVRPNSGRVEPGERIEVQVLLQPMKDEPPAGTKCRDKFLVQSAIITPDRETRTLQELWATVEAEAKQGKEGAIHEQKIRCAFLPPVDGSGEGLPTLSENTAAEDSHGPGGVAIPVINNTSANNDSFDNSSSFANGSNAISSSTPSRFSNSNDGMQTAPSSAFADRSIPSNNYSNSNSTNTNGLDSSPAMTDAHASPIAPVVEKMQSVGIPTTTTELKNVASNAVNTVSNAASSAAASVGLPMSTSSSSTPAQSSSFSTSTNNNAPNYSSSSSGNDSSATLSRDLAIARAEIERLKLIIKEKDSSEGGLRQRNVGGSTGQKGSGMAGSQVATVTQEGIPLPMVGAIAAGVFVFTWLFF